MNNYEKKFKENYKDRNGNYVYARWDFEEKKFVKEIIRPGENGVTAELIELLNQDDNRQKLSERYDSENLDWKFALKQQKHSQNGSELTEDPLDLLPYKKARAFEDEVKDNEFLNVLENLTDEQIDLIYDLFGMMKSQSDIARETGKTQQSVYNKKTKIIKRLRKLFKEIGMA